ncbi:MAG: phenylacetate--CoA ligase family protein, partial [Alistipes sp.]|nr:phenylacetate--CoA ligase family protein [Alistipes sp.]
MIKDTTLHYKTPEEIKAFQEARLQEALAYLQEHSTFYRRMFQDNNIDISAIKSIEDLTKIPTTSKQDLQSHNADFLCVSPTDVI